MYLIVAAGLTALLLALPGSASASSPAPNCAHADELPTPETSAQARTALLCLLNAERAGHRRKPLHGNPYLGSAAQSYAEQLDPNGPLVHVGSDHHGPRHRIIVSGYARHVGSFDYAEALGRALGSAATPGRRVSEWMLSPTTRRLLMAKRFRDVGLGVAVNGDKVTFVVNLAYPVVRSSPARRSAKANSKRHSGSSSRSPKSSRS